MEGRLRRSVKDGKAPILAFADDYVEKAYEGHGAVDPLVRAQGRAQVVRGGSWRSPAVELRATHRGRLEAGESRPDVGFRCAYNVPHAQAGRKSR